MPDHDSSRDISIQSDGVKIGWNIMATLAAMGIGMYVFIVLAPIKTDISHISKSIDKIQIEDVHIHRLIDDMSGTLDDRIDECETKEALFDQRIRILERANQP